MHQRIRMLTTRGPENLPNAPEWRTEYAALICVCINPSLLPCFVDRSFEQRPCEACWTKHPSVNGGEMRARICGLAPLVGAVVRTLWGETRDCKIAAHKNGGGREGGVIN